MISLPVSAAPGSLPQDGERLTYSSALQDALHSAKAYALADKADATRAAYRSDFLDFTQWCQTVERPALPADPSTVAAYLAHLAERRLRPSTIGRRLAAIRHAHKLSGHESPTTAQAVQSVHQGIRRRHGTRPKQKAPATAKTVASMIRKTPADTLAGKRDRALLLLGFSGALRRSELVALDVEHIEAAADGIILTIVRSKTDQDGRGQTVAIPNGKRLKPAAALQEWLSAASLTSGPIFRQIGKGGCLVGGRLSGQAVAVIVKKYALAAGLNPDLFSGHSLRAGLVTEALAQGADVLAVADQGRWRKLETVREYDRRGKSFQNHVGRKFL
jgi:site-specific recombinase XerD